MEGGEDAETFASGMAAISTTMLMLLNQGDHIVASADVYGGTYGLMTEELPRLGIETTMADIRDPSSYEAAIQDNTKMMYIETITNPNLKVCDIPAMVDVAKRHNLMVIVDNTFASPWGCQPLSMGADLVIHSTTKFLGGHSDLLLEGRWSVRKTSLQKYSKDVFILEAHRILTIATYLNEVCAPFMLACQFHFQFCRISTQASRSSESCSSTTCNIALTHSDYEVAQRVVPKGMWNAWNRRRRWR